MKLSASRISFQQLSDEDTRRYQNMSIRISGLKRGHNSPKLTMSKFQSNKQGGIVVGRSNN